MIKKTPPVKYLWPGEKTPTRADQPYVATGGPIFLGLLAFVVSASLIYLALGFLWPGAKLPGSGFPLIYHLKHFWLVWLGKLLFLFPGAADKTYLSYMGSLSDFHFFFVFNQQLFSLLGGAFAAYWVAKKTMHVVIGIRHERGPQLLTGEEAFNELDRILSADARQPNNDSGLVLYANERFRPLGNKPDRQLTTDLYDPRRPIQQPSELLPDCPLIKFPEDKRRTHTIITAGTGRAKTQLTNYLFVAPIYSLIRTGEPWKMLIVDTKKGDYAKQLYRKHQYVLGPTLDGGEVWDISNDIQTMSHIASWWFGLIPQSDAKEKIWDDSARMVGVACTTFLQAEAKDFNFGMHAYLMTRNIKLLQDLVQPYYEVAAKVFGAANETLVSVEFNLAARVVNLMRLAEIYDGYSIKKEVCQATAKSLRNPKFLDAIYLCMLSEQAMKQEPTPTGDAEAACRAIAFKAVAAHLNKSKPAWQWVDFAKICRLTPKEQAQLLKPLLTAEEHTLVSGGFEALWEKTCSAIVHYADEWDRLEAQPKVSIRDWLKNEKPERSVLVLRPSEGESELTRDYIAGLLNYANQVILDELPDSATRRLQIIIDELASLGNLQRFLAPAQEMFRSKGTGLSLIFQDYSQAKKIYGPEFLSFMQSNTANCFFLGAQPGETTDTISKLIGDRTITKTHITVDKDGNRSTNEQSHPERVVTPDELNLLGARPSEGKAYYVYWGNQLPNVYELELPLLPYKERSTFKPNPALSRPPVPLDPPSIGKQWRQASLSAPAAASMSEDQFLASLEAEARLPEGPQDDDSLPPEQGNHGRGRFKELFEREQ